MKATLIKDHLPDFQGRAALYRMEPPHEGNEFVVASAVNALYSGPETYLFPSDADGLVIGWNELEGSYRGGLSHAIALGRAGYSIA